MTTEPHAVPVHFSHLKHFARSPAHYLASVTAEFEDTRAQRVGKIVHHIVLGPHRARSLVRYPGQDRKGGEWKEFAVAHNGSEIVTQSEWDDAEPVANAVLKDPVAAELLKGTRREVGIEWHTGDVLCATDGIDFVGDGYIGDLKSTTCTEPSAFSRHSARLLYHAQMAWMVDGASANGIQTHNGVFLLGVEVSPPHAVTVLRMGDDALALGRKSVSLWLERLRACRANAHWPAYTQSIVDFELPPWLGDSDMGMIDA